VRIYQITDGRAGPNGYIKLEGMSHSFERVNYRLRQESGVDVIKLTRIHEEVKKKHLRNESEFWIKRPLTSDLRDYASFDIMQLQVLHKAYAAEIAIREHIEAESKRYVEMHKARRPLKGEMFVDNGILPQEILQRNLVVVGRNDKFGTRVCEGCKRELHQDSFLKVFSQPRMNGLCYSCREVKRFRDRSSFW